jgi:hypothetical protein
MTSHQTLVIPNAKRSAGGGICFSPLSRSSRKASRDNHAANSRFGTVLVKPQSTALSAHLLDSNPEIKFEKCPDYPLQFAILDIEAKHWRKLRLAPFLFWDRGLCGDNRLSLP